MTKPVRFGILGCGRITRRGLVPGIRQSKNGRIAALASLRPGVAAELAAGCGDPKVYDSYEAVLADPNVDAVYIPTSGEEHHRWTLAAAKAGKHVLCEKSLAMSVAEAEEMVTACREHKVQLQEAFMWRHHPRSLLARTLLQRGEIGPLRLICAHFSFDIDRNDWRLDPARGGGAVWDIGCYGVNASRYFTGAEPTSIYARADFHPSGADMSMQIALTFPGNVFANIDCSFAAPFRCEVELVGERGTITLPNTFLPPEKSVLLRRRETSPEAETDVVDCRPANQYCEMVDSFCESVAAGRLQDPAENGLANMRVLERALQVARESRS